MFKSAESVERLANRLARLPGIGRKSANRLAFHILKLSIDEAVEMGKRFGTEDSGPFINGILDNIYNTLKQEGKLRENN